MYQEAELLAKILYTEKEKGGKPDRKPYFPMVSEIHTVTSSLRTLKIMHRNLNGVAGVQANE
jgi:hypothetical protein